MTDMVRTSINNTWELTLPDYRARRPEWNDWETARLNAINATIKPTDIVLEVGAEEGDLTALVASWVPRGGIYIFEPNPRVWTTIRKIWEANDLALPLSWFVGFASNTIDLSPSKNNVKDGNRDGWPECAYNRATARHGERHLTRRKNNSTPQTKLDDWLKGKKLPNIIMIDVDGGELEVLKGAAHTLITSSPTIFVSVHPDFMMKHLGQYEIELHNYLKELGYIGTHLGYDHEHHWFYEVAK